MPRVACVRRPALMSGLLQATLQKWPIFSSVEPKLRASIALACVFGSSGQEVIFATSSGELFSFGINCSGCLGTGDALSSLEPRRVSELNQAKVTDVACGSGPHVVVVTQDGAVYSWGHNGYGQLGQGTSTQALLPMLVAHGLSGKHCVRVACGSYHTLVLTDDGEVFAWGQNGCGQIGSGSTANQSVPRKVTQVIGTRKAVDIACGQLSSVAVTDSGDVYTWGYNASGQLGLGSTLNQAQPCRVTAGLTDVRVVKVVCGFSHTLCLSNDGVLFSWGANSNGQLGIGNKAGACMPTAITAVHGRFVDVAATHYAHISAAAVLQGKVFVWGQCRGQAICEPMETGFADLADVFAVYCLPPVMPRAISVVDDEESSLSHSLSQAFDDSETADVRFCLEGRVLHAHKAILKIRCQYFRSMFKSHWAEGTTETVEMTSYSYGVYTAFIKYLYTNKLDSTMPCEDIVGLLDLANSYCEWTLKRKCELLIRQKIDIRNVAHLYALATKLEARELEELCVLFAVHHLTDVVKTDAYLKLDDGSAKALIREAANRGAFRY